MKRWKRRPFQQRRSFAAPAGPKKQAQATGASGTIFLRRARDEQLRADPARRAHFQSLAGFSTDLWPMTQPRGRRSWGWWRPGRVRILVPHPDPPRPALLHDSGAFRRQKKRSHGGRSRLEAATEATRRIERMGGAPPKTCPGIKKKGPPPAQKTTLSWLRRNPALFCTPAEPGQLGIPPGGGAAAPQQRLVSQAVPTFERHRQA